MLKSSSSKVHYSTTTTPTHSPLTTHYSPHSFKQFKLRLRSSVLKPLKILKLHFFWFLLAYGPHGSFYCAAKNHPLQFLIPEINIKYIRLRLVNTGKSTVLILYIINRFCHPHGPYGINRPFFKKPSILVAFIWS